MACSGCAKRRLQPGMSQQSAIQLGDDGGTPTLFKIVEDIDVEAAPVGSRRYLTGTEVATLEEGKKIEPVVQRVVRPVRRNQLYCVGEVEDPDRACFKSMHEARLFNRRLRKRIRKVDAASLESSLQ